MALSAKDFSKTTAILANSEEQINLSRALSQLGEIYEKVDQIYLDQANADYFIFSETVKDYVSLFDNIKEVFYQRVKSYSNWQRTEEALKSKRDAKQKLESQNKLDKVPTVAAEIRDVILIYIKILINSLIFERFISFYLLKLVGGQSRKAQRRL